MKCIHLLKFKLDLTNVSTFQVGLLFDKTKAFAGSTHNHCAYNWETNCDQRPSEDNPIASPGCPYQVYEICNRKYSYWGALGIPRANLN